MAISAAQARALRAHEVLRERPLGPSAEGLRKITLAISAAQAQAIRAHEVCNAQGMSWQTADLLSADTTDVLAADTTDVLPADTTHGLPAGRFGVGTPTIIHYF